MDLKRILLKCHHRQHLEVVDKEKRINKTGINTPNFRKDLVFVINYSKLLYSKLSKVATDKR